MTTKIYDADQVAIIIAGRPLLGGFADGEFVRIERESPAFDDVVGTDGEVSRSKTNDNRATVTVLLMQTSDSNAILSALHNQDKIATGGSGVGPLVIKDLQGTTLYASGECWVRSTPNASFDRTATSREWEIRVANLQDFTGGN